jgi:ATP-dependent exoDNAse (exonuclease V) beta subunit
MSTNTLEMKYPHPRDSHIEFDEPTHTYTIDGSSDYTSVTTWNHTHFNKFDADKIIDKMMSSKNWKKSKYFGKTANEIKTEWDNTRDQAAAAGTKMHYDIECFYNEMKVENDSVEYKYFKDFVNDHKHLKPYRTEWTVWDSKLKIAGSIDMVFENADKTLSIYDWKRSKKIIRNKHFEEYSTTDCISHIPDTNFWHYALQLNTYKALIERNYNKKVTKLCLVCLHPNQTSYELFEVPELEEEMSMLFKHRTRTIT